MQVVSIEEKSRTQVHFDGFVPMIVEVVDNTSFPDLYCRIGDFISTLVEIGIDRSNGAFRKLKLIAVPKLDPTQSVDVTSMPVVHGTPTFDVSRVASETARISEHKRILVGICGEVLTIQLEDDFHPSEYIQLDRLIFVLDQNRSLCSLLVHSLTEEEIANLKWTIPNERNKNTTINL